MPTLLHILLLALWPGCLFWFLAVLAWDDYRDRRTQQRMADLTDREFCDQIGIRL